MFFKFDKFTQRLSAAPQDVSMGRAAQAMTIPLEAEAPKIVYDFKTTQVGSKAKASTKVAVGGGPGVYPVPNTPAYKKLMELQTKFTANDGKMVWQKLPKDMPLYYLSIGLVVAATGVTAWTLLQLASPPKNQD